MCCSQGRPTPTIAPSPPADVRECKIFLSTDVTMAATSTTPLRDMRKLRVAELREWLKAKEVAYLPRDTKRTLQQIATAYLKAHVTPIDKAKVDGMTDEEVSDALELRGLHRRGNLETRRERLKSAAQETPAADGNGGNVPASAAGVAPQASTGDSALLKQLLGELAKVNSRMDALEARGPSKRSPAATASAAETKQEETAASQWRAAVDVDMTNEGTSMTPAKRSAEDIDGPQRGECGVRRSSIWEDRHRWHTGADQA